MQGSRVCQFPGIRSCTKNAAAYHQLGAALWLAALRHVLGDNDLDFAVPALRAAGVNPDQAKLIGADGNRSAYERIRKGNQYQTVTVSEPIELQAYQAVDEFNRAFNKAPPSGFIQPPYLVTPKNVNEAGGTKNIFVPDNDYKKHYLQIWGVAS